MPVLIGFRTLLDAYGNSSKKLVPYPRKLPSVCKLETGIYADSFSNHAFDLLGGTLY